MALTKAQTESLRALALALEQARRGEKRALVEESAERLGLSVASVYRELAAIRSGGAVGETAGTIGTGGQRKKRADAGTRCVDRDLALQLAGLVHTARRQNGKKTMTMKRAARILEDNGYGAVNPENGEVTMPSVSTLSRVMREHGCHPEQLKRGAPTGTVRTRHPNHSWQMDPSVCVLYYLPGGKMAVMDERQYNERKPGKLVDIGNQRILRYIITDHCTHSLYLHYAVGRGETAAGALTALIEAMSDRGPLDPMHGIPLHLYADPASAHRASLMTEFCQRLGIKLQHHTAGKANATGSVEVAQRIVENEFEGRLRFASVTDLAGLQAMADSWRIHFNAYARHTRLRMPRNAAWIKIRPEQLRTASKDALIAISRWKLEERTVSDRLTISVDTRLPGLPPQEYDLRNLAYAGLRARDKVRVELNPFTAPDIIVIKTMPDGEERRWEVSPIVKDEWGFDASAPVMGESYKALPKTDTDRALEDIKAFVDTHNAARKAASGLSRPEGDGCKPGFTPGAATSPIASAPQDAGPSGIRKVLNVMADLKTPPLYFRPKGRSVLDAAPVAAPMPLTHAQAAVRLRALAPAAFNRDALACMDYVRGRFPEYVGEDKLAEVAGELTRRFAPVQTARVLAFDGARQTAQGGAS